MNTKQAKSNTLTDFLTNNKSYLVNAKHEHTTKRSKIEKFKIGGNNQITLSTYDITLGGVLIAMSLIVTYLSNLGLPGILNVDFEIIFFIFFGLIFGPLKGAFFGVILDNLGLLIRGRIGFGMWEYAIIGLIVPMLAGGFFQLIRLRSKYKFILPLAITSVGVAMVFGLFFGLASQFTSFRFESGTSHGDYATMTIILTTASSVILLIALALSFLSGKTKKERYYFGLVIIALIVFIQILVRGMGGPIAGINYLQRFTRNANNRTYENAYAIYMIPIVLKSLVTIPLYSFVLIASVPSIIYLEQKYKLTEKMSLKRVMRHSPYAKLINKFKSKMDK